MRRNRGRRNNKKNAPVDLWDAKRKSDALQTAKHLKAQGMHAWAVHWEKYANSPAGTPQPPNYHTYPASFGDESSDPRMAVYPRLPSDSMSSTEYEYWMNRQKHRPDMYKGASTSGGGGGGASQQLRKEDMTTEEKMTKLSNKELGEITDEKGNPYLLLKKLRNLQKEHPQVYRKSNDKL
jgi:hypothetical protein